MRRPQREVTQKEEMIRIIEECQVCRMGLNDNGNVYVVPMNFGYEFQGEHPIFYLHSAKVGRKIEVLKEYPQVAIELDCRHELMSGEKPCDHSYYYASLMGNGTAEILADAGEKERVFGVILKHQTGKEFAEFDPKWVNAVAVVRVELTEYTCKEHKKT